MNLVTSIALIVCLAVASAQHADPRCPMNESAARPTHLAHTTDCARFFKCARGIAHEMTCPNGQHWNAPMNYCDTPARAQCLLAQPSRPNPAPQWPTAPIQIAPQPPQMWPQFPGGFPGMPGMPGMQQPGGCGNGNCGGQQWPGQQPCGGGNCGQQQPNCGGGNCGQQQPNCGGGNCAQQPQSPQMPQMPTWPVAPPQVQPSRPVGPPQMPTWPVQPPQVQPISPPTITNPAVTSCPRFDTPGRHILFAHNSDCNIFFQCIEGQEMEIRCPMQMHFNEATNSCDSPQRANCRHRIR